MNILRIVKELQNGNLVITPTDTVYGIMADAMNEIAIIKVFEAKHRNYNKPLILLVNSIDMLKEYVNQLSKLEKDLINSYFPGKLTIILKKNNKINNLITAGSEYVGIRIPDNKDLLNIITKLGRPVISTSANIADRNTITNINEIDKELLNKVSYIEDNGEIKSCSSTIIKVENEKITILREGILSEQIKEKYTKYMK